MYLSQNTQHGPLEFEHYGVGTFFPGLFAKLKLLQLGEPACPRINTFINSHVLLFAKPLTLRKSLRTCPFCRCPLSCFRAMRTPDEVDHNYLCTHVAQPHIRYASIMGQKRKRLRADLKR